MATLLRKLLKKLRKIENFILKAEICGRQSKMLRKIENFTLKAEKNGNLTEKS